MPTVQPHDRYDDAVTALDETWYRFVAYCRAVVDAGPDPDEATWFALVELEFACAHWRERFLAALGRLGVPLEYVLGDVPTAAA